MYNKKRNFIKRFLLIKNSLILLLCLSLFFSSCKNDKAALISGDIGNENIETISDDEKEYIEINLTSDNLNIYQSDKFVLLKNEIPYIKERIRYSGYENFIGKPVSGYEGDVAILTKEAANALKKANEEFNKLGLGIVVYDAYRPMRAVEEFVKWTEDLNDTKMKQKFYPNINKSDMIKNGYISKKSGHSRGSTIDLSLYDLRTYNYLDMGGEFDYFGEKSHYDYKGLTIEQKENRKILRDIMVKFGFKPINTEWWHFTFIDEPYKDEYFDFPVSKKMDVVFDENKNKRINIEVIGDYIDADGNIDYNYKNKKYANFGIENLVKSEGEKYVNEDLKQYLNKFNDILSDDEFNLILYNLPFLEHRIYFDVDYNDYTKDEMEEMLSVLLKIYNKEKEELEIKYFDAMEDSYYPYGYNKSFLISNIKSLKNAIDRKEYANVNRGELSICYYNEDLSYGAYDILSVSDLKENSYYEVELVKRENTLRELFIENDSYYNASNMFETYDIIDIYGRDIREEGTFYKHNIYEYLGSDDKLSRDGFNFNGKEVEESGYSREKLDYIFEVYKVKVLKNAAFLNISEDYGYDTNGFDIYEYHGNVDIDNPINNLELDNNLFMDKVYDYTDESKNIEDFMVQKNNFDDYYITQIVFDEKGYVTHLYRYVR